MTSSMLSSRWLFAAATVALAFTAGGCGREACFTWSAAEGSCPAQAEALPFFSNPDCPGKVVSVDSEATRQLDVGLCCYDVTEREATDESICNQGFGGASSTESSSFAASTGQGGISSGTSGSCAHCDVVGLMPPVPFCEASLAPFHDMVECACMGACAAICANNFCAFADLSPDCFTCLEAAEGCRTQFVACVNAP